MVQDKYIGLGLAISSSFAIGTSFIITKKGLIDASKRQDHGGGGGQSAGDTYSYLKNPIWWMGMVTMIIGEVANFAAYTFAPAILVTPLGALSVLIGSVLASIFLKEQLGVLGRMGCAICLIGSVIIILHAPPDSEIQTIDEMLEYAIQPGFISYCLLVVIFASVLIYKLAPKYGKRNPMIYVMICSTVGSISVMAIKAFGICLKLTLSGNNQFSHPSTYIFALVVGFCIMIQMNYLNKALDQFDTSIVNPLYYVTFTTSTLVASFILFHGFNTSDSQNAISLICGFLIIFAGVYLLNLSRMDPSGQSFLVAKSIDGMPMDNGVASFETHRRSMQTLRQTTNHHNRINSNASTIDYLIQHDEDDGAVGLSSLSPSVGGEGRNI